MTENSQRRPLPKRITRYPQATIDAFTQKDRLYIGRYDKLLANATDTNYLPAIRALYEGSERLSIRSRGVQLP